MQIAKVWLALCGVGLVAGCSSLPPALDPSGYGQDRISTGIDDAQTDVAFLDNYQPQQSSLTGLVPRGPNQALLALPGLWEGQYWSYCLHAGVHRPGEGDGYVYAPLKGPDEQVIRHILQNQLTHPEVQREKIQALIWAILARTKMSDASPDIRATAQALLSPQEIDRLNGGALGKLPPALFDKIVSMLPPELRQAARVNADLRGLIANPVDASYEQLERIGAPIGDFPAPAGSREIPAGRWSYDDSQRVFVRYFPTGYSSTRLQFYAPEKFTVERDQSGRIGAISDLGGTRLEITYKPEDSTASIAGDPAVHARAFASIRLTAPNTERPWETNTFSLDGTGWVLTGVPSGSGRASVSQAAAMQQRYDGTVDLTRQVRKLGATVHKRDADQALDEESLVEFGEYAVAMQAAYDARRQDAPWLTRGTELFYRAWMSNAAANRRAPAGAFAAHTQLAEFPEPSFDPSGSAAQPGNTGKQRLAQSGRDNHCENGAEKKEQTEFWTESLSFGDEGIEILFGEGHMPSPLWLPGMILDEAILGPNIDLGLRAMRALAGCPVTPAAHLRIASSQVTVPRVAPSQLPSEASAKALHELVAAWGRYSAQMKKAAASQEQYRAALAAGDKAAAGVLARELTNNLRASGVEMLQTSAKLSAVSKQLRREGLDPAVTLEGIRKYQEQLKANGIPKEQLEAVKKSGLSDEDIKAWYARRLEPVTNWEDTTLLRLYDQTAAAMQELGRMYAALPAAG
jgi:hypothetical protein